MSGARPGAFRTAEHVEREYGREKWPAIERAVEAAVTRESPRPELPRVFSRVVREDFYPGSSAAEPLAGVVGGEVVKGRQSVLLGGYQSLVTETLIAACTDETELVVELGAGWGRNLFALWLGGGPAGAEYVAAEYTAPGRRVAERLAEIAPDMALRSLAFDYNEPDLSALPRAREAVVFTAHSIEQVPLLTPALLTSAQGVADRVTGVHFEPVGWQLGDAPRSASSSEHASLHDYNRNLVELLLAEQAAGRLKVTSVERDVVGANPANATTLIAWVASRSGSR